MRTLALLLCLAAVASLAAADTIYLKNGKSFEGKLVSDSGGSVKFKTSSGAMLTFPKSQVDRVEKGRTAVDEYADRRREVSNDDVKGLLALARWCEEVKLRSQRAKLFRIIRKLSPNHPEARREMKQVYRDGKWVKAPKGLEPLRVARGDRVEIPKTMASLALPKGWGTKVGDRSATATGPDRYSFSPVLRVRFPESGEDTAAAFPEKDGWEKPAEASAAGYRGLRSRRVVTVEQVDRVELSVVLSDGSRGLRVALTCLLMEERTFAKAVDQTLDSVKFKAPPADYTNTHYKYSLNLPKPKEVWQHGEDDEHDLAIQRKQSDATEFARLLVVAGNPGQETDGVTKFFESQCAMMKATGDMKEEEIQFAGEKTRFVDGTFLSRGVPLRARLLFFKHGERVFFIMFLQHEYGQKHSDIAWDTVFQSFRFTD